MNHLRNTPPTNQLFIEQVLINIKDVRALLLPQVNLWPPSSPQAGPTVLLPSHYNIQSHVHGVLRVAATLWPLHKVKKTQWPNCGSTIFVSVTWLCAAQKDFSPFTYMGKETSVTPWIIFWASMMRKLLSIMGILSVIFDFMRDWTALIGMKGGPRNWLYPDWLILLIHPWLKLCNSSNHVTNINHLAIYWLNFIPCGTSDYNEIFPSQHVLDNMLTVVQQRVRRTQQNPF